MKRHAGIIVLLASAIMLAGGIFELFLLRFQAGDVYPEYSSLRADPLGTMVFYESLSKLPGLKVSRDFSTNNRLLNAKQTTYLELAVPFKAWQLTGEQEFREMERFVQEGGRLLVTTYPAGARSPLSETDDKKPPTQQKPVPHPYRDLWGVNYDFVDLKAVDDKYESVTVQNVSGLPLPQALEWHSGIVFRKLHPEWKPLYIRDRREPVMIQRQFGRGTVILSTDSYFLSNEAMLSYRHPDLLAFLIGSSRNIVFDEAHLGTTENPGVVSLIRRYRLHGLAASLIAIAVLYIWKMSLPLVPASSIEKPPEFVAGKGAPAAMINLLRRGIPPADMLETCFNEWKKSLSSSSAYARARIERAEAAFIAERSRTMKQRDAVKAYRTISQILEQKTTK